MEPEKNFSTLCAPSLSIARSPKKEFHCASSSGSSFLSFPFLQILTNQPQNRQRMTCKENYWQKNIHKRTVENMTKYTQKSVHCQSHSQISTSNLTSNLVLGLHTHTHTHTHTNTHTHIHTHTHIYIYI